MNATKTLAILALSVTLPAASFAQGTAEILATWVALDAPTGHEHHATAAIEDSFSGWSRDRYGNLSKSVGQGEPERVIACGLDSFGYAISQVTEDGYLRLHRIGSGSRHPLWDQSHEGQQLRILAADGPVVGVSAVANGHFAYQHRNETAIVTADDLWLDVGAESAEEVSDLGIALLDPVIRHMPAWSYANEVAGAAAGSRVGCAALVAAAQAGLKAPEGTTRYVMTVQSTLSWLGLGAALARSQPVEELIVLMPGEAQASNGRVAEIGARADTVIEQRLSGTLRVIRPQVANAQGLTERVTEQSANTLLAALRDSLDPNARLPLWLGAPAPAEVINGDERRFGTNSNPQRLALIETLLDSVAEQSAVPGHEGPVRQRIYDALPAWARAAAEFDELGNMWVDTGGGGEATVFIAHMDEVGYEVEAIGDDGVVSLRRLGGVVTTAWEGQPALLQLDPNNNRASMAEVEHLRGVFLSRSNPQTKSPPRVQAWFGMNGRELRARGVSLGMGVTGYKEGHRMGAYRYSSRSLDDRVGTTALLLALQSIDPESLPGRVIFAWSVREEGGLVGAAALARRFATETRRVYSIDTFVSSQTPLESPHFAFAPLGSGPVLRSVENSGLAVPTELARNKRVAAEAGIGVQVGLTQGSTDGTTFSVYGAPNAGLSWPGRYSHSPAEIADLRDVAGLIDLITAMAMAEQ